MVAPSERQRVGMLAVSAMSLAVVAFVAVVYVHSSGDDAAPQELLSPLQVGWNHWG